MHAYVYTCMSTCLPACVCVKDRNGQVLSESEEVCERWREYFDGLLNVSESGQAEITARPGMNVRIFEKANANVSVSEVLGAVSRLKGGKASGLDEMKTEYLKSGGYVCAEWMVRLLNVCLSSGSVPSEWKIGCIVPLYKGKGGVPTRQCRGWGKRRAEA